MTSGGKAPLGVPAGDPGASRREATRIVSAKPRPSSWTAGATAPRPPRATLRSSRRRPQAAWFHRMEI